jgi:hypothetical protein
MEAERLSHSRGELWFFSFPILELLIVLHGVSRVAASCSGRGSSHKIKYATRKTENLFYCRRADTELFCAFIYKNSSSPAKKRKKISRI